MSDSSRPDLDWILNHLGEDRSRGRGAVAPPIYQSAMFCFDSVGEMREKLVDELANPFYTRGNNPTVEILRAKLAALEGAEDSLVFSSGSAAIAAAVITEVGQGDEVVCIARPYSWTGKLLQDLLQRFGVDVRFVEGGSVEEFQSALSDRTRLIVLESPNSITFNEQDLSGIASLARDRGITTLCDNSYATPLLQRPIEQGIDLVAHSATKYLNGHSDAVAGVLCGRAETIRAVFEGPFMTLGANIGPHDAWLLLRGLRTLPLRLERIQATTTQVVEFLDTHPRVRQVFYPRSGLGTGLLSLELDTDEMAHVDRFCNALQRFLITCSWGGHESLVYPVCALHDSENYRKTRDWPMGLIRLSIGLESPEILIRDLRSGFEQLP